MGDTSPEDSTDFRLLADHLDGVALWIVSEAGEFQYISAGAEGIWGIPAERLRSDPSLVINQVHEDDRARVRSLMEQPPDQASEESYEVRIVQPDETIRWVHVHHIPIRNHEGDRTYIAGITTDITEQKQREIELEELNRILRHDIRNDLGIILGWSEMLEDHVDEQGEDYLERITAAAQEVLELTTATQDTGPPTASDDDLEIRAVSLQRVLRNEIELRRELFPTAEFTVVDDIPDVNVLADEMLTSVFRNLFNNAVQHNHSDTPVVEIGVETDADHVVVTVADNGPGIPEEAKAAVFDDGQKGPASSGTGIGLHLVKTIVEQYDGSVWVTDNDPTGSVFHVKLDRP